METTASTSGNSMSDGLPDRSTVDRAAQSAHEAIDRVAAKAGPALDKVRATVAGTKDTLRAKADQLSELEDQWLATTRDYVRENPLTAVAIGVVVGAVLARLASAADDQVRARALHAIPDAEMTGGFFSGYRCDDCRSLLTGGTWSSQALPRSQEGVLVHSILSNQSADPSVELPAHRTAKRRPRRSAGSH